MMKDILAITLLAVMAAAVAMADKDSKIPNFQGLDNPTDNQESLAWWKMLYQLDKQDMASFASPDNNDIDIEQEGDPRACKCMNSCAGTHCGQSPIMKGCSRNYIYQCNGRYNSNGQNLGRCSNGCVMRGCSRDYCR